MDLALIARTTDLDSVEEMAWRDSLLLLERHYEQTERKMKIDASLHGMKLT